MLLGTPFYMAPEAVRSPKVEPPADVFAFGILAVEMLTGRAPFSTPPMFRALAGETLEAPRGLDRIELPLRELVAACLSLDPADRPSMRRIREALEAHAG